ncbi:MAG: response regulator [Bacteroidota bacterium]
MNILLVEDNPGDIMLAKEALKEARLQSHSLSVVTDGDKALDFLNQRFQVGGALIPDLIILDLNIPCRNGKEVLRYIKEHPSLRHIPVVVFSTSAAEHDVNTCYKLQANCYVTKPIDFDDFVDVISSIVNFWSKVATVRFAAVA